MQQFLRKRISRPIIAVCALFSVLVFIGSVLWLQERSFSTQPATSAKPTDALSSVPDVAFLSYAGDVMPLRPERRPRLYMLFATWCVVCEGGLRDAHVLAEEFVRDIDVVLVNRAEPSDVVQAYLARTTPHHAFVAVADPNDTLFREMGGFAMPEYILVDTNGVTQAHFRGPQPIDALRQALSALLGRNL